MMRWDTSTAATAALGMLAAMLLSGCGGTIPAPTAYKSWNAKDGTFRIDYPEGWQARGGGKQGVQWARFNKGAAEIRVRVDVSSSLMGDILETGAGGIGGDFLSEEMPEQLAPVAQVHEMNRDQVAGEMRAYKEEDAIAIKPQLGDGRKSPFTASEGLGSKIQGYRATVLSNDRGIHVICKCPAKYWDTLRPAFDKVLDSLTLGTPE